MYTTVVASAARRRYIDQPLNVWNQPRRNKEDRKKKKKKSSGTTTENGMARGQVPNFKGFLLLINSRSSPMHKRNRGGDREMKGSDTEAEN